MQEVSGSIPLTSTKILETWFLTWFRKLSSSSRGLGHDPFTVGTGVRIPVRTPQLFQRDLCSSGGIAQLGERLHGMQEVSGSIPLTSTKS